MSSVASEQGVDSRSSRRVRFASLIGTSIEFFDFYAYATAAVLVFPELFFPSHDPATATLQSLATFALAFFARPLGAVVFGHFGDRFGRKATLVGSLLTMGTATVIIGLLPAYASIGVLAPVLLALCRFAQGLGLGGEWGGAVLLATENAPRGKEVSHSMFPQLGAPIGLLISTAVFAVLSTLGRDDFLSWGWRVPFIASAGLVLVGLYVRLRVAETAQFRRMAERNERVAQPLRVVVAEHATALSLGTLIASACFVIMYLMTVFALGWATSQLGFARSRVLGAQMTGVVCMAAAIVISARLGERLGPTSVLMITAVGLAIFGMFFGSLLDTGTYIGLVVHSVIGFTLAGLSYGPLGAALASLFPTAVRYTGISLSFNLAGVLGASLTPYLATSIALHHGLSSTGYYLSAIALISLAALTSLAVNTRARAGDVVR